MNEARTSIADQSYAQARRKTCVLPIGCAEGPRMGSEAIAPNQFGSPNGDIKGYDGWAGAIDTL